MPFLSSLAEDAHLIDVFKKFPGLYRPLIEYHEILLRGPSPLSVAERELIAAYVSGLNSCHYCHGVHTATAEQFGVPEGLLGQLIENPEQAPIEERMKPLLAYVKKLTYTPSRLLPRDAEAVFVAGWNEQALHDAVSVCGLFNLMNRLVDGLGVTGDAAYFKLASARLASGGYSGLLKLLPH
jgi:uncharacterized peroxidase-related enzyme